MKEITVEDTEGGSFAFDPKSGTTKRNRGEPSNHENMKLTLVSPTSVALSSLLENSSTKRSRGRPKGSGKLQRLATIGGYFAATAGGNFCPHVVIVKPGEDIVATIVPLLTMPEQALSILSAVGSVSSVSIHQPSSSYNMSTFVGSFRILSLSGLYKYRNKCNMEGRLSISLAKPNGQVFGGAVGGAVIAERPIQLIVATFKQNVMLKFNKKIMKSKVSAPGIRIGDPVMVRNPMKDTVNVADDTTPHGDAGIDTVAAENENENSSTPTASPISVDADENALLQVSQPNYKTSEDVVIFEDKNSSPVDDLPEHRLDEIGALKDWKPISEEKTSPAVSDENENSAPDN